MVEDMKDIGLKINELVKVNKSEILGDFYYSNGDKYEGDWVNGIREGRGK